MGNLLPECGAKEIDELATKAGSIKHWRAIMEGPEKAAIRAVGKRGVKALREITCIRDDSHPQTIERTTGRALRDIAKRHRRKGLTIKDAFEALDALDCAELAWGWMRGHRRSDRRHSRRDAAQTARYRHAREKRKGTRSIDARYGVLHTIEALRTELEHRRIDEVRGFFDRDFAHGECCVRWIDPAYTPAGVSVGWDWGGQYSSRVTYRKKVWSVVVRARKMLRSEMPGGKRVLDGLCTLDAEQLPSPDGRHLLWKATWARKDRGVSWSVVKGYIAECGGEFAHGARPRDCVATLKTRQTKAQTLALAMQGIDRKEAIRDYGTLKLRWGLARKAGLCAEGIKAWSHRHFPDLDPRTGFVTVRQALETGDSEYLVGRVVALAVARERQRTAK